MIKLYGYKKCSTCRRAEKVFEENGIDYTYIDITENSPTLSELKRALKVVDGNVKKIINTSGLVYRTPGMKEKIAAMSEKKLLALLSKEGRLVKRPMVFEGSKVTIGMKQNDFNNTWLSS